MESVNAVLQFINTGDFNNDSVSDGGWIDIYILADYICLEELCTFLLSKRIPGVYFKTSRIMELLILLKRFALPLRSNACQWFRDNREMICKTEGFQEKMVELLDGVQASDNDLVLALFCVIPQ